MFHLFIEKDFESKRGRKRKTKRKRESIRLWYMWNILTNDGIYCCYLKYHTHTHTHIYIYIFKITLQKQLRTFVVWKVKAQLITDCWWNVDCVTKTSTTRQGLVASKPWIPRPYSKLERQMKEYQVSSYPVWSSSLRSWQKCPELPNCASQYENIAKPLTNPS